MGKPAEGVLWIPFLMATSRVSLLKKDCFLDHLFSNDYHLSSGGPNPLHRLRDGVGWHIYTARRLT